MNANYRRWLRQELKNLQGVQEPDLDFYEGLRQVVSEAGRRAAEAGIPAAVEVCAAVRPGPISQEIARHVLARCLEVSSPKHPAPSGSPLTPPQVAKKLGVSPDTVLDWIRSGQLKAVNIADPKKKRPRYRVEPEALAEFKQRRSLEPPTSKPRRSKKPKLLVTRYSASQSANRERGS